jgi:sec-independent protein translocase protein TatA
MHMLVIFGLGILFFGPKKLPELGKGLGEGILQFKKAFESATSDSHDVTKQDSNKA